MPNILMRAASLGSATTRARPSCTITTRKSQSKKGPAALELLTGA